MADVNLLLALLVRHHEHHRLALKWFDRLAAGEAALCRMVQLALVRLMGNEVVMGRFALSASNAWTLISELLEDERLMFSSEPPNVEVVLPDLLRYPKPTSKLVADAYLAAFAIAGDLRLATFDKGFREFKGLNLELL